MKTIKVLKWKEDTGEKGVKIDQNTTKILTLLINILGVDPNTRQSGFDGFQVMRRVGAALDKSEKSGTIKLEEGDYNYLKKMIESNIPSHWGMSEDISKAMELFMEAKSKPEGGS